MSFADKVLGIMGNRATGMQREAEQRGPGMERLFEELKESPFHPLTLPKKGAELLKRLNDLMWASTVAHSPVGSPMTSERTAEGYRKMETPRKITEQDKRQAEGLIATEMASIVAAKGLAEGVKFAYPYAKPYLHHMARNITGKQWTTDQFASFVNKMKKPGATFSDAEMKLMNALEDIAKVEKTTKGKLISKGLQRGLKIKGVEPPPTTPPAVEYQPVYRPEWKPPPTAVAGQPAPLKPTPPELTGRAAAVQPVKYTPWGKETKMPAPGTPAMMRGTPEGAIVKTPEGGEPPMIMEAYPEETADMPYQSYFKPKAQEYKPLKVGLAGGTPESTLGGEVGLGNLPARPPERVTPAQLARGHQLAQNLELVSERGRMKPQYRRLAESVTGRKSMKDMSQPEAEDFINTLEKLKPRIIRGEKKPPKIPTGRKLAEPGFFEREFKKPSLIKFFTPSDRYAYSLGVADLTEPLIKAKSEMILAQRELHNWLEDTGKKIDKFEATGAVEKITRGIRGQPTTGRAKWFNLLDTHETAAEAGLAGEQATTFNELRDLTRRMLERTNEIRQHVGLEPINNIKGYVTHISDALARKELTRKYPFPEEIKYWLSRIKPIHIYNPTALHRQVADREGLYRDPVRALKSMVSMDLKQIYLEQPNLLYREQMKALQDIIPAETRHWVEAYVNEVIKGYPTKLDNLTNETLNKIGVPQAIDVMLKPFGRTLGMNPARQMYGSLGRLIHDATIWGRAKLVVRNHLQKFLTLGLYDSKAFVKGMLPANSELKQLIGNSDFFKISKREFLEALPQGMLGKLERVGFIPYGHSHVSNVGFSEQVAYHAAKELVNNPKYAKLNWTMEDVVKEMDFGANTTQYFYNLMGMPEVYRSGTTRAFFTLQSWWQNYFFKYWREMLHRAFSGKTGWGKEIPLKWRLGALRHIAASVMLIEGLRRGMGLDYKRTALLGVLPTYFSPITQVVVGLGEYMTAGSSDWQRKRALWRIKNSYKAFVPGSAAWRDFQKAWGEYETGGMLRAARELLFHTERETKKAKKPTVISPWERLKQSGGYDTGQGSQPGSFADKVLGGE